MPELAQESTKRHKLMLILSMQHLLSRPILNVSLHSKLVMFPYQLNHGPVEIGVITSGTVSQSLSDFVGAFFIFFFHVGHILTFQGRLDQG